MPANVDAMRRELEERAPDAAPGRPQRHAPLQQPGPRDDDRDADGGEHRWPGAVYDDTWCVNEDAEYHEAGTKAPKRPSLPAPAPTKTRPPRWPRSAMCRNGSLALGLEAALAAAAGYALGILAHWLVSSRAVFTAGVAERGPERNRQKALFVGSALAGLALTTAIVGIGSALGLDPRLAKLLAIGASFTLTWLLRERVVFRPSEAA
jgi:putative flippase GtrA